MKRYLKILFAVSFIITAVLIDPPFGGSQEEMGKRIQIPGQPPIIVIRGSK